MKCVGATAETERWPPQASTAPGLIATNRAVEAPGGKISRVREGRGGGRRGWQGACAGLRGGGVESAAGLRARGGGRANRRRGRGVRGGAERAEGADLHHDSADHKGPERCAHEGPSILPLHKY